MTHPRKKALKSDRKKYYCATHMIIGTAFSLGRATNNICVSSVTNWSSNKRDEATVCVQHEKKLLRILTSRPQRNYHSHPVALDPPHSCRIIVRDRQLLKTIFHPQRTKNAEGEIRVGSRNCWLSFLIVCEMRKGWNKFLGDFLQRGILVVFATLHLFAQRYEKEKRY